MLLFIPAIKGLPISWTSGASSFLTPSKVAFHHVRLSQKTRPPGPVHETGPSYNITPAWTLYPSDELPIPVDS